MPGQMFETSIPIVNTTSFVESVSADAVHAKAIAIISVPVRFCGRRRDAIRPAMPNAHMTGRPNAK